MDNHYRFEKLSGENMNDLLDLFNISFSEKARIDFLKKKYDTNRFGLSNIGYLAYFTGQKNAAAYYGVFPIKVEFEGKQLLAAQSGDTMTHPEHRGKGLFIKLANLTYELAKQNSVEFIFGFPNKNSYGGFIKKLDWKHYGNINNYRIRTGAIPLEKVAKRSAVFKVIYDGLFINKIYSQSFSDIFPNSIEKQIAGCGFVSHDQDFFDYKHYYPSGIIEVEGVKCWVKIDGRLWIGDIDFCEKKKFFEVVEEIKGFAKKKFCSTIHFSVYSGSLYDQWLREKYNPVSSDPIGCLDLNGKVNPELFAYQAADFDTF